MACVTDWYVAHTKPRQESTAREQLERQGFEVYLPLFKVFKKSRQAKQPARASHEPMFPSYLFLRPTRPEQSLSVVRSTIGISRLVMFGLQPAMLSDDAVRAIRQAEAQREHATTAEISPFKPGMQVEIQDSPLAGLQGLVQAVSKDRVTLLLHMLGRPQTVQVSPGHIQSI